MSEIRKIENFAAPELDVYARLSEPQLLHYYEPQPGLFLAESPRVIERALDVGYEPVSFLAGSAELAANEALFAHCPDAPVYTAETKVLEQLTGFALTRGMLCAMHRRTLPAMEEICRNARRVAILENVVNPTNVGAIFRSAAALGIDAVLLTSGCSNPAVPPRHPREHGKCLPGPMDRAARRQLLAGAGNCCTAGTWILYRCDGIKRRLRSDG